MTCKRAHHSHVLRALGLFVLGLLVPLGFNSMGWAQNSVPLISQPLVPEAAAPGGLGFTLTVNGTGFVSGAIVHWNGAARTTHFVNGSRLRANISATDIASAGTAAVTVVNPGPGGGTSGVVFSSRLVRPQGRFRSREPTLAPHRETSTLLRQTSTEMASWT